MGLRAQGVYMYFKEGNSVSMVESGLGFFFSW